ncbi:Ntn hydrolase family protein [Paraliomyxa miuraensis]|uniref:hypothetical protein n=1 Tax=Paraliomyxa miuraensis TaxID=376150 RepID=UPI00225863BC|nr:hypothetical protein [Paraliomyxa miuraensis]MCX4244219.1 hypothetical protein [Paraliomyxa miuraensis]
MSRRSKSPAVWGAAVVAGIVAFVSMSGTAGASSGVATGEGAYRVAAVRGLAAEAGLPAAWGDFFALVAWRESKGNPQAVNDSVSEAAAAAKAFDRNRERYEGCGHPEDAYTFGSGGWFGMLPANGLAQLGEELYCLPPSSVLEPRVALAMAVGFARGLMRWDGFAKVPTWLNLRTMWGRPAKGGDLAVLAKARVELAKDAAEVGLPASWLDGRPPPLPVTGAEVLDRLQAA